MDMLGEEGYSELCDDKKGALIIYSLCNFFPVFCSSQAASMPMVLMLMQETSGFG